jgi:hypothetical protein
MITAQLLVDLSEEIKNEKVFNAKQIISAAVLGSTIGRIKCYNPSMVYMKNDKVPVLTDDGELIIAVCNTDYTSGAFNPLYWEEWDIFTETKGLYEDYIILSWNRPSLRRNKVWIQVKSESLGDISSVIGKDMGVIVYNNLIISERQPVMTSEIVWGMITEIMN